LDFVSARELLLIVGKKKTQDPQSIPFPMPLAPDHWTTKEVTPPDSRQRWIFRKNLHPKIPPRHADYQFIAYLTFHFQNENGCDSLDPSPQESALLRQIEESEIPEFEDDDLAVYVGAVQKDSGTDMLFYTRDTEEFFTRAAHLRDRFPRFNVACEVCPDPNWEQFDDLP
jgi:hypothetical protein